MADRGMGPQGPKGGLWWIFEPLSVAVLISSHWLIGLTWNDLNHWSISIRHLKICLNGIGGVSGAWVCVVVCVCAENVCMHVAILYICVCLDLANTVCFLLFMCTQPSINLYLDQHTCDSMYIHLHFTMYTCRWIIHKTMSVNMQL